MICFYYRQHLFPSAVVSSMFKISILLGINQKLSQSNLTQYHHHDVLTDDLVLSLRQVIANHATYVSPETVANAVNVVNGSARISEMGVQLSCTLTH